MPVPTIYRSTDVGAPAWSGSATAQNRAKYMMQILKACLVDGYAGKDPAGWTLVGYDDVMPQLAIANGSETGALRLTFSGSSIYLSVYQSMSAIDAGVGGVSLDYVVSSQGLRQVGVPPSLDTSRWCVVADAKTAVMWWCPTAAASSWTFLGGWSQGAVHGFAVFGEAVMTTGMALEGSALGNFVAGPARHTSTGGWVSGYSGDPLFSVAARPDGSINSPALAGYADMGVLSGGGLADYGAEYLVPYLISQAAPAPGSTASSSLRRTIGHHRGLWRSLMHGSEYWKARFASDAPPGTVIDIGGRQMMPIPAVNYGEAPTCFISLETDDWP